MNIVSFSMLANTFSTMLNINGESKYPYLFPDLMRKEFSLSLLGNILSVGFS